MKRRVVLLRQNKAGPQHDDDDDDDDDVDDDDDDDDDDDENKAGPQHLTGSRPGLNFWQLPNVFQLALISNFFQRTSS